MNKTALQYRVLNVFVANVKGLLQPGYLELCLPTCRTKLRNENNIF